MTAYLADSVRPSPLAFDREETRQFIQVLADRMERNCDCCKELFVGVFFDGTNNNRDRDRHKDCHSNIARLFDAFPQDKEAEGIFSIYAPGVGTKFDDVGDTGSGDNLVWGETDRRRGLAFAERGEARIVWALLNVLNNLHIFFTGGELCSAEKTKKLSNDLTEANVPLWAKLVNPTAAAAAQWIHKRRLIDARRNEVLGGLCRELEKKIKAAQRNKPKPKILGIRLSVFGFSRGAAQARVFSNWFVDMCHAASGSSTLAGLPVDFDFLGIFDTVASVGLANSTLVADGHMEWADAETNLRIPSEVKRCVHLVSAHEVRRSFPLDSIGVGQSMSKGCTEIVYPGVHSDVGGGYRPCEQGRGIDAKGDDMLSRVALAQMYREARLANVPLDVNAKGVTKSAKAAMAVADRTREAFNAYLAECKLKSGRLSDILDEQTRLYVRWRRLRLESMTSVSSVQRATPQDRTDLLEANRELAEEVRLLETPLTPADLRFSDIPVVTLIKFGRRALDHAEKRGIDGRHYEEWLRLKADWKTPGHLPAAVSALFEDWVHDSRAWFKPFGDDDHIWEKKQLDRMKRLERQETAMRKFNPEISGTAPWEKNLRSVNTRGSGHFALQLTDLEKSDLAEWKRSGRLPTQPSGREPYSMGGGYLRYRRVYFGSDANIVAMQAPIGRSVG